MCRFIEVHPRSWGDVRRIEPIVLAPYVFRGQGSTAWQLSTSLERAGFINPLTRITKMFEYWSLHEFRKKYHLYSSDRPDENDLFEWLAIMQHHGTQTRLLDFTRSIFVAAYFAACGATEDAVIWAINWWMLRDRLKERFQLSYNPGEALRDGVNRIHIGLANDFIASAKPSDVPAVIVLEPKRCTERLSRQQGLFLMPTLAERSFMANLSASLGFDSHEVPKFCGCATEEIPMWLKDDSVAVIKIILPKDQHRDILDDLCRMNITAETLFPGLDGLARSLSQTAIRV